MSFAAAREMVLHELLGEDARLLETPNNVLGVEYIKALFALGSDMTPITTARSQTQHDMTSNGPMRSASQGFPVTRESSMPLSYSGSGTPAARSRSAAAFSTCRLFIPPRLPPALPLLLLPELPLREHLLPVPPLRSG